jgi:glycine oxidase
MTPAPRYDVTIAGAGLIGLALALELHAHGASVAVFDTARAMRQTSVTAAGMLAAEDPHNPPPLRDLAGYSLELYPDFLERVMSLSGLPVPIQTTSTVQYLPDTTTQNLAENSLDPRQLGAAVLEATCQLAIPLFESLEHVEIEETSDGVHIHSAHMPELRSDRLVHAIGAWFTGPPAVMPRKGQMLRVQIPSCLDLHQVHRSESIYIVPRTQGPQAGTALIGATNEDAGFDRTVHQLALDHLRALAATLLPDLASPESSPQIEAWAGLRPATTDGLPLLGPLPGSTRQFVATGHYRNGILLAPATAATLTDVLQGRSPAVDLRAFTPARFL